MPTVAYIANEFPSPVEPYVVDEIRELRRRRVTVIACTARATQFRSTQAIAIDIRLQPLQWMASFQALALCIRSVPSLWDFWLRILFGDREPFSRRLRCVLHTWLGVYYAILLRPFHVDHIHAHHGYFSSWIAMVAARLLNAGFSFTLHGSDLLLHPSFLDKKLGECDFCFTISEFNRTHILKTFPTVPPGKILVQRLGVDVPERVSTSTHKARPAGMLLLSVGRLHTIKNQAFLIDACAHLRDSGMNVLCWIAGEGPARASLEQKIASLQLENRITLLGHVPHDELGALYDAADLVVLTSQSEGIPLALMEAMIRRKLVLAPSITGIPELVEHDRTGFLYQPGSLDDFVTRVLRLHSGAPSLDNVRDAARAHVLQQFERQTNLNTFGDLFLAWLRVSKPLYASSVLQQI